MIRTCPRCGDFYADDSLLFCLADGTPLADVEPSSETWAVGTRVAEEKERVLRRRTRRLKWRRVLMTMTTVLITTMVVYVVAVNGYIYLTPEPDAPVVAAALTQPSPEPSESPSPTPTPTSTSTLPFVPTFTPTPTPTPTRTTTQACTADDRRDLSDSLIARNVAEWRKVIERERDEITRANMIDGAVRPSVTLIEPVHYKVEFSKACAPVSVNAAYAWRVRRAGNPRTPGSEKKVDGTKTFTCAKAGPPWRCG